MSYQRIGGAEQFVPAPRSLPAGLPGRRAIHILPIAWAVDGQGGVRDPRAMFGKTLGVELLIVSVAESVFSTLGACVERAHLQLDGVVAAPFVSAQNEFVFTPAPGGGTIAAGDYDVTGSGSIAGSTVCRVACSARNANMTSSACPSMAACAAV